LCQRRTETQKEEAKEGKSSAEETAGRLTLKVAATCSGWLRRLPRKNQKEQSKRIHEQVAHERPQEGRRATVKCAVDLEQTREDVSMQGDGRRGDAGGNETHTSETQSREKRQTQFPRESPCEHHSPEVGGWIPELEMLLLLWLENKRPTPREQTTKEGHDDDGNDDPEEIPRFPRGSSDIWDYERTYITKECL
jgi:hypothetical protein